jgi:hypothetical protein
VSIGVAFSKINTNAYLKTVKNATKVDEKIYPQVKFSYRY